MTVSNDRENTSNTESKTVYVNQDDETTYTPDAIESTRDESDVSAFKGSVKLHKSPGDDSSIIKFSVDTERQRKKEFIAKLNSLRKLEK